MLGRPKGCIGTLPVGFTRLPDSGSIGMDQEEHEELQTAGHSQVGRGSEGAGGGAGGGGLGEDCGS